MKLNSKNVKFSTFALMLICFILPFQNQDIASINGFKLAMGSAINASGKPTDIAANPFSTLHSPSFISSGKPTDIVANPLIALTLLIIVGFLVYISLSDINNIALIIANSTIAILLIAFKVTLTQKGFGVSYKEGYWLLLILSIGSVILNRYLYSNNKKFPLRG